MLLVYTYGCTQAYADNVGPLDWRLEDSNRVELGDPELVPQPHGREDAAEAVAVALEQRRRVVAETHESAHHESADKLRSGFVAHPPTDAFEQLVRSGCTLPLAMLFREPPCADPLRTGWRTVAIVPDRCDVLATGGRIADAQPRTQLHEHVADSGEECDACAADRAPHHGAIGLALQELFAGGLHGNPALAQENGEVAPQVTLELENDLRRVVHAVVGVPQRTPGQGGSEGQLQVRRVGQGPDDCLPAPTVEGSRASTCEVGVGEVGHPPRVGGEPPPDTLGGGQETSEDLRR